MEFRNPSWVPQRTAEVLKFLRDHRLVYVAVDCPWQPLIPEASADTAVMRLHGRNIKGWQAQMRGKQPSVAEKYDYLYSPEEVAALSETARSLEEEGKSTFQSVTPEVMEERRRSGRTRGSDTLPAGQRDTAQPQGGQRSFHLQTRQEQAPNPASRVTLSAERDELGMPRARLDWRLTELDRRSFRQFYEVLGREIGRAGVGRVQMRPWVLEKPDAPWPASVGGGWHHMGTTRMHRDPREGVVDPDCRVHGIANLSVAGAAVFPTAGAANPTLTLVALSLRLSDHLKSRLT